MSLVFSNDSPDAQTSIFRDPISILIFVPGKHQLLRSFAGPKDGRFRCPARGARKRDVRSHVDCLVFWKVGEDWPCWIRKSRKKRVNDAPVPSTVETALLASPEILSPFLSVYSQCTVKVALADIAPTALSASQIYVPWSCDVTFSIRKLLSSKICARPIGIFPSFRRQSISGEGSPPTRQANSAVWSVRIVWFAGVDRKNGFTE